MEGGHNLLNRQISELVDCVRQWKDGYVGNSSGEGRESGDRGSQLESVL